MILTVVLDTTKVQIFKQITTRWCLQYGWICCFRYHKGTDFQANHNSLVRQIFPCSVVLDTTKVQIFKQITTPALLNPDGMKLFQIPQRYRFSSKSQLSIHVVGMNLVVLDTTKVQIFKQITTVCCNKRRFDLLFQIPQRYRFSSKSQPPYAFSDHKAVVLDTTKVQIFKQITTVRCY